jgi:sulfate transport system permease protein
VGSARVREPRSVRWGLRLVAIVYVFLLVLWPVSLVVKNTFAQGTTALTTAPTPTSCMR